MSHVFLFDLHIGLGIRLTNRRSQAVGFQTVSLYTYLAINTLVN